MNKNDYELCQKVNSAMYQQIKKRGYAAPVDVLMDLGVLSKANYERWRHGQVNYLERVCTVNLRKLSVIMHQMRVYAGQQKLKPSFTYYKQWAVKGKKIPLRFSKSGTESIEKAYATHYVSELKVSEIKHKKEVINTENGKKGEEKTAEE